MSTSTASNVNEEIKTPKKIKKEVVILIILIAVLIIATLFSNNNGLLKIFSGNTIENTSSYEASVESKLKSLISKVEGVGNVEVMVTVSGSEKELYAVNTQTKSENGVTTTTESVAIVNGKPILSHVENPEIISVVVVCAGGNDISVKFKISEIITSLYSVPLENIKIYKMK